MDAIRQIKTLLPIIYPAFYIRKDEMNNEMVFLRGAEPELPQKPLQISDKTLCESMENHVHLFDNPPDILVAKEIGLAIAHNLSAVLKARFPQKHFFVYLVVVSTESITLRFHQIWSGELPYYREQEFYKNTEITVIKT